MHNVASVFSRLVAGFVMSVAATQFPFTDNGKSASAAFNGCAQTNQLQTCGMRVLGQAMTNVTSAMVATSDLVKKIDHDLDRDTKPQHH